MDDLNQPATKADLCDLEKRVDARFEKVGVSLKQMTDRLDYQTGYLDKILTVVSNMDARLTPKLNDHEKRIQRLEVHAGLRSK